MVTIKFEINCGGMVHHVETFAYEYRSLMLLIYDRFYPEDFGECRGVGRFGTCHVEVTNGGPALKHRMGNESTTLDKMNIMSTTASWLVRSW